MPRNKVKIRGKARGPNQPYPLNEFPKQVIQSLCSKIVHSVAVGYDDMEGNTFSQMYANAIKGKYLASPVGIADITWQKCAWSAKTVKDKSPHTKQQVRLISGRNSPDYSADISNPREDIQATGKAVLDIYNERIKQARADYSILRLLVMLRNMSSLEFTIFERDLSLVVANNYQWKTNNRGNFEGYLGDRHCYTWQPHGSQFTIIEDVPSSACRFRILHRPNPIETQRILEIVQFKPDWVEILDSAD